MKYILFLTLLFVSACSTHLTTLKQDGKYKIYNLPEEKVFQIVYQEMNKVVDDEIINELDGPERGFTTRMTFGLDWYNVIVKIVPVEGPDHKGEIVKGYFVELGGKGTYPTNRPQEIIDNILLKLNDSGGGVYITSFKKTDYARDRDRWRLTSSPSAREHPQTASSANTYDDLRNLKKLYDDGIITQQEYDQKKKVLLEKIK